MVARHSAWGGAEGTRHALAAARRRLRGRDQQQGPRLGTPGALGCLRLRRRMISTTPTVIESRPADTGERTPISGPAVVRAADSGWWSGLSRIRLGQAAVGGAGPVVVVLHPPGLDDDLGLEQRGDFFDAER